MKSQAEILPSLSQLIQLMRPVTVHPLAMSYVRSMVTGQPLDETL